MPLYNPKVVIVDSGCVIVHSVTKEELTVTDTQSVFKDRTIFCTERTFELMKDSSKIIPHNSTK